MKRISNIMAAALVAAGMATVSTAAVAQSAEQYAPIFSYRTGPYAPNGIPVADGTSDYLKLVNARGGINGVKFKIEECEFAFDTAKGMECYERTKDQHGGAAIVQSISTGVTAALLRKQLKAKSPLLTAAYAPPAPPVAEASNGAFPFIRTYLVAADEMVKPLAEPEA